MCGLLLNCASPGILTGRMSDCESINIELFEGSGFIKVNGWCLLCQRLHYYAAIVSEVAHEEVIRS